MSYSFTVEVKEDGTVTIPGAVEETPLAVIAKVRHVPAGKFEISGHVEPDGKNETLNISRRSISGDVVALSQSWHK